MELDFLKPMFCAGALLGLHLVEPFLSLTTSTDTTYSKLIPAFHQLYEDLQSTDASRLLDVHNTAFQFVSQERFELTRYDADICEEISRVTMAYEEEVLKLLNILLPQLASGFLRQKGSIFGFGNGEQSKHALSEMDKDKLEQAPVHNIAAERSVGYINYELACRGAKQLQCASSSQVKSKASDLIGSRPSGSFRSYSKLANYMIPQIMKDWNDKQEQLRKDGLQSKEIANIAVDKRRNKDLDKLKAMGGPFTSTNEVEEYLRDGEIDEKDIVNRLYLEVRYARDTALSIPKTSDIFRLLKEYKKLPAETYAKNFKLYLDNVTSKADVSIEDFNTAVDMLLQSK